MNTGNPDFEFVAGLNRYWAVARDADGGSSPARTVTNRVNAAPVVGAVMVNVDPIPRNGQFTLTATGVADNQPDTGGGTIARVEFYRDINNNGTLDIGTDLLLGSDTLAAGGYTFTGTALNLSTSQPNRFFARAVDTEGGVGEPVFVEAEGANSRPNATSMTATPAVVPMLGGNVTLTAVGVTDVDGTIQRVRFYRDNGPDGVGDGIFNIDPEDEIPDDVEIGQDLTAAGGYTVTIAATEALGFATGVNRVFAVPFDNDGEFDATPATATFRINAVPVIDGLTGPPTALRLSTITLTTDVVDQGDSVPAGTISRVEFYRDVNGNGTFEAGTDRLLGVGTRQGTTSIYTLSVSTAGFDFGLNTFFVRAQDNNLGFSTPGDSSTTVINITNNVPLVTSITVTPNPLVMIGNPLTLTAVGQRDTDGTVASVRFYRDNGDNVFNIDPEDDIEDDILLGADSNSAGGFSLVVDTSDAGNGFVTGTNRYFAVAVDNNGGESVAATATSRVNARPVIDDVSTPPTTARGAMATVTATDVLDNLRERRVRGHHHVGAVLPRCERQRHH